MEPPRSQDFAVKMIASEGVIKSASYYEKEQERERRQVRIVFMKNAMCSGKI